MPKYEYTVSLIKRVLRFEEVQVRVCSNEPLTKGQAIANAECNEKLLQNLEHEEARYCLIPGGEAEVHIVHQPEEITTVNLSIDGDETNFEDFELDGSDKPLPFMDGPDFDDGD